MTTITNNYPAAKYPNYEWNKETVLENGHGFLDDVNRNIKDYSGQWEKAQKSGFYTTESNLATKNIKYFVCHSRQEMRYLESAAKTAIQTANGDEKKKLKEIIEVSKSGREYLSTFLDKTYFPTEAKQSFFELRQIGQRAASWLNFGAVLSLGLTAADQISGNKMHTTFQLSFAVLATSVAFKALSVAKTRFYDVPREQQVQKMQSVFEQAIETHKTA